MNLKFRLILWFTDKPIRNNIIIKCRKCKKKTAHSEHGFRYSNYRIQCKECGEINYCEESF